MLQLVFLLLSLHLMFRKKDTPNRLKLAVLLLTALLLISVQLHAFSTSPNWHPNTENDLSFKQAVGSTDAYGILQDDNQLCLTVFTAFTFLLAWFYLQKKFKVRTNATPVFCRNYYCIFPKGP